MITYYDYDYINVITHPISRVFEEYLGHYWIDFLDIDWLLRQMDTQPNARKNNPVAL